MEKCQDIMTRSPYACLPSDPLAKAAQIMRDENVGAVPVVEDEDLHLVGMITDRDIALSVAAEGSNPESTLVDLIMTQNPLSCGEQDSVDDALSTMAKHQIRRIPVVDRERRIVGIIAQSDIARRLGEPKKTAEVVRKISEARQSVHE